MIFWSWTFCSYFCFWSSVPSASLGFLMLKPTLFYIQALQGNVTSFNSRLFQAQLFLVSIVWKSGSIILVSSLVASNSSTRMKPSSMSVARTRVKLFSSMSKNEIFQLIITNRWPYNSSTNMKLSSNYFDRVRVKSFSFKSKDETFELSFLLIKNDGSFELFGIRF